MATTTMTTSHRGVALLVAVIFTAVMLSFGILISSLGYKQTLLTQSVRDSQYAFYAADTGLECLLRADQTDGAFVLEEDGVSNKAMGDPFSFPCDGVLKSGAMDDWAGQGTKAKVTVDIFDENGTARRCAQLEVYKPTGGEGKTWLFSQGYSVPCSEITDTGAARNVSARFATRGLRAPY
jgi:hypothetical protein